MARRHLEGDGRRARIGIVVPSVNTVMEPWAQRVAPEGVSIFAARMFIPPRPRQHLNFLWRIDGKTPPVPPAPRSGSVSTP